MIRTLTLGILFLTILSCKKPRPKFGHVPKKMKTSKASRIGKTITTAAVASGAFIVTEEVLKKAFANSQGKEQIEAQFKNSGAKSITIGLTQDGTNWINEKIKPFEVSDYLSNDSGIIGVKCDDKFFKIEQNNYFTINNNGGTINFYGQ